MTSFNGSKYVSPLFRIVDGNPPEQGATATWLAVGNERFLTTAAHSIDEGFTWFPTSEGLKRLSSRGVHTTPPSTGRMHDLCDLAIFHLNENDQRAKRSDYEYVGMDMVDVSSNREAREFYEFTGYPYRKGDFDKKRNRGTVSYASVVGAMTSDVGFHKLGLSIRSHVVVAYTKKNILWEGKRINLPLLHGMSGGGVWKVGLVEDTRKLAGIAIECPKGWLVGVRISAVLEYFRVRFPELSPSIPSSPHVEVVVTRNGNPVVPANVPLAVQYNE